MPFVRNCYRILRNLNNGDIVAVYIVLILSIIIAYIVYLFPLPEQVFYIIFSAMVIYSFVKRFRKHKRTVSKKQRVQRKETKTINHGESREKQYYNNDEYEKQKSNHSRYSNMYDDDHDDYLNEDIGIHKQRQIETRSTKYLPEKEHKKEKKMTQEEDILSDVQQRGRQLLIRNQTGRILHTQSLLACEELVGVGNDFYAIVRSGKQIATYDIHRKKLQTYSSPFDSVQVSGNTVIVKRGNHTMAFDKKFKFLRSY
jgi:hypothetical protein